MSKSHYNITTNCRICGKTQFEQVVDLGDQCLQGSFVKIDDTHLDDIKIPTSLIRCVNKEENCSLVQLSISVPQDVLYSNYWYESGVNNTMKNHLASIVKDAIKHVEFKQFRVLDIGCNDGTLLSNYKEEIELWGVDPSDIAKRNTLKMNLVSSVFPSSIVDERIGAKKFDIITSIAMFYDLPNPVEFAKSVEKKLADNGIWIIEMSYLPLMLEMNSFDTICHEHVEYYKLSDLVDIGKRAGFSVKDCSLNYINGGSIRVIFEKDTNETETSEYFKKLTNLENKLELNKSNIYNQFKENIEFIKEKTISLINDIKERNETIHVYGASTKGNVLLQYYGLTNKHLEFASERNLSKVGHKTLGSNIPIISEKESRELNPNYYFVLPWHFGSEFLERETPAILKGTKMIFPLPELLVIDKDNLNEFKNSMQKPLDIFLAKYNL